MKLTNISELMTYSNRDVCWCRRVWTR